MKIGITYDLRDEYLKEGYSEEETAEFDSVETIESIENALKSLGHSVARVGNAKQLLQRLAKGERWDLVFNICEGLRGLGRESVVPGLLELYEIPYTFSDPATMALCLHKGWCKAVLRQAGLPTGDFVAVSGPQDLADADMAFPVFVKPVAEGTGKGISADSRVDNQEALGRECEKIWSSLGQPALVETYLPGREFTVGILGTGPLARVIGTLEVRLRPQAQAHAYSLHNKEHWKDCVEYLKVHPEKDDAGAQAESVALSAWRLLGCRDGGRMDLRCDAAGNPVFIEANPLAGLRPGYSDLPLVCEAAGLPYEDLIAGILDSAMARYCPKGAETRSCA
ncbi:MAG: D-alanine--D-alanine ligase [Candidatus Omnitrophica bacterium]|nr:D-alanine--D-alanine ligase [Candidatus Omnitrophota bacterium]